MTTDEDGVAWAAEGDYTYDELLTRVFNIMREKNPELMAGEKKRFTMRPPQVVKIGTKKTSFANFSEICKMYDPSCPATRVKHSRIWPY